jgi:LPS export ABC transporter protein LptC
MVLMLLPVFIGSLFFLFSAILALIKVNDSKLPDDFKEIKIRIENYRVEEKNPTSGRTKWILTASSAESDSDQNLARVQKPYVEYFEEVSNSLLFTIYADYGVFNKSTNTVELYDNIELRSINNKSLIQAGFMSFSEDQDNIRVGSSWTLQSSDGSELKAEKGSISKDLNKISGKGSARLKKDDFELKAESIEISQDGKVFAQGNVEVNTGQISCFSKNLEIISDKSSKPIKAFFRGNPRVLQEGSWIFADLISYDFQNELVSIEGNVHSKNY